MLPAIAKRFANSLAENLLVAIGTRLVVAAGASLLGLAAAARQRDRYSAGLALSFVAPVCAGMTAR